MDTTDAKRTGFPTSVRWLVSSGPRCAPAQFPWLFRLWIGQPGGAHRWCSTRTGPLGQVQATVTIPDRFRSYPGVVHGGIVATILDEVSGRAIMLATGDDNAFFVTAKMEVRYRRATPVNTPLLAVGWVERMGQSRVWVRGELRLEDIVLAECKSLIVLPSPEFLAHWGDEEPYWRVYSDEELQQARSSSAAHIWREKDVRDPGS